MKTLRGTVERITFKNNETCYIVARVRPSSSQDLIAIVGTLPGVAEGEEVSLEGEWVRHKAYGWQFRVDRFERSEPATLKGIQRYLASGLIKGIGPRTAEKLVEAFGKDALRVIVEEPERVSSLKGIGSTRAVAFRRGVEEGKAMQKVMVTLQDYDVSPALALRIYRRYQDRAADMLREDPYRLAEEVQGIGFRTADRIAQNLGMDPGSPSRLAAALLHVLNEALQEGHVFLRMGGLLEAAAVVTGNPPEGLREPLGTLKARGRVVFEGEGDEAAVYLTAYHRAEMGLAGTLRALRDAPLKPIKDWEVEVKSRLDLVLHPSQVDAIRAVAASNVAVITGGPGTGKTTVLRALVKIFSKRGVTLSLAAPTGRAAKRLSEVTGEEAKTLHRLLEFRYTPAEGGGFFRNEHNPLPAEVVIVDEASMVDLMLAYNLMKALKAGTRLVLVGDADQLPSVGAGSFLRDVMSSGVFPVAKLSHIFRQASESMIVVNAHRINAGLFPRLNVKGRDFFFVQEEDPERLGDLVVDLCVRRVPRFGRWDPIREVQVLAPMRRGAAGVEELNRRLQENLNPPASEKPELKWGGGLLRLGDKVMQISNNYEKEVFNGDSGLVTAIHTERGEVTVAFHQRDVTYDRSDLDELVVSYAISVHKSQGSEYPVVIVPVTTQHYMMLQRNLLYTALTRAKNLVVLAGTKKALAIAVRNNRVEERNTLLGQRLRE